MQEKKLNVLFIPSWYPNKSNPTLGIFIKRHAEALSALHNISVINTISDAQTPENTIETDSTNNIYTVTARYKKANFPGTKLIRSLKAFKKAYEIFVKEKGKPDIIHLHVIYPAAYYILFTIFFRDIPVVISEHWSGYMKEDGNYKGALMKLITGKIVKRANAIIAVSEKMKSAMLSHNLQNNYHIVPNVVDTNLFHSNNNNKKNELFTFIHVSSINDREKNISGILRVAKKLSKQKQNFILNIIGDSNELNAFIKLAQELGINNKYVFFKGTLPPQEVADEMRKSDAFLMFSNYEGLPCVILEALACGLPIIASITGGIPSVINAKNGLLVEPKNEGQLLSSMEKMIGDHPYNKTEIASSAVALFSYSSVAKQIDSIYKTIIA